MGDVEIVEFCSRPETFIQVGGDDAGEGVPTKEVLGLS